jgi:hypothetical protein
MVTQSRRLVLVAVAAAVLACCCHPAAAAVPAHFPVFEPCAAVPGSGSQVGMCRRVSGGGSVSAAAVRTFPIDMRLPCMDPDIPCSEVGGGEGGR